MDNSRKMESDYRGLRRTAWSLWEKGVPPSDIHRRLSAVCGQTAPARSTVFNWVRSFSSGKATAQVAVHGWYNNITNIGSVKPPGSKDMAPMYNIGWKYVDLAVV